MSEIWCPLESIETAIAVSVRDWSENNRDAWIYGIVFGWEEDSMQEMIKKHHWSKETVQRLNILHNKFKNLKEDK